MKDYKLIQYKGFEFCTDLDWHEYNGQKSAIKLKIQQEVKKHKGDAFGVKIDHVKELTQIGYAPKEYKGVPSLAKMFTNNKKFKSSLVIIKLSDDTFWMCGLNADGQIVVSTDKVYAKDEFVENFASYASIDNENLKIIIAEENDFEIQELLADELLEINVQTFDQDEFFSGSKKKMEVELVYNSSLEKIKQAGVLGAGAVALVSSYFFVYLEDPLYNEIINQEISAPFYSAKSSYDRFLKKQESDLSNAYELRAKIEILSDHHTDYTNVEIYDGMKMLGNIFPWFLVEWELGDIKYSNSNGSVFKVEYKRIESSYGNIPEIRSKIDKILAANNITDYTLQTLSPQGNDISININLKKIEASGYDKLKGNFDQSEINNKIRELEAKTKKSRSRIENLEFETTEFSFFDKRFGSALSDRVSEIEINVYAGKKAFDQMKKEGKKLEITEVEIDENIISGSRKDVLSMMQSNSYFAWKAAPRGKKFPSIENMNTKKGQEIPFYAQSINFEVGDAGNIDIMGHRGLRAMLVNKELLNKPYIKITECKINLNTEIWKVEGEYYEKI